MGILGGLGTGEIILILAVMLLMFGGKKLPELARGLGKSIREFNDAKSGIEEEIKRGMNDATTAKKELPTNKE